MGIPCMAITPTTAHIMANYHAGEHPPSEIHWLRVGLVLFAAQGYTDGHLTETDMHGIFDLAFSEYDDNIRVRGHELLP